MSDEKKPFAEVVPHRIEWKREQGVSMLIAGGLFMEESANRESLRQDADRLNAAVEQREANLRRDVLLDCHRIAMEAHEHHNRPDVNQRDGFGDGARGVALRIASRITELQGAATGAYVPAAELAAEQAKTAGVWAVLADVANEGGLAGERATELIRALGLRA